MSRNSKKPAHNEPKSAGAQRDQIKLHDIVTELEGSFLDYSMSVIVSRALPDARDGLKPVQRRILVTMHDEGLVPGRPYKKSAAVVGQALSRYHPHGDTSVYDALVRQAQPWVMNEPLVDGQGNFGSIDNDPAAAYRYTEARMTQVAGLMLKDLDKNTVDFIPNFDGEAKEPVVLPAALPNLLLNGSEGIAVGMATKIPPHNLRELGMALDALLEDPSVSDRVLFNRVKGPDFPTGGFLLNTPEIKELYKLGRGKLTVRARTMVEKTISGKTALVVIEMPYAVSKAPLLEKMAAMVRENGNAPGTGKTWSELIDTIRDESDREGMRAVIELKRTADPRRVLAALYKKTDLEVTYGAQMIALVDGAPRQLGLREALDVYVAHRLRVVIRRTEFDLGKAEARAHIVDGLLIAVQAIDEIVKILKKAKNRDEAKSTLQKKFSLSEIQAEAIMQMRLASLTGLDVSMLRDEKASLLAIIKDLKRILGSDPVRRQVVRDELKEGVAMFGRARRTEIVDVAEKEEGGETTESADEAPVSVHLTEQASVLIVNPDGTWRVSAGTDWKGKIKSCVAIKGAEHAVAVTSLGRALPVGLGSLGVAAGSRGISPAAVLKNLEPGESVISLLSPEEQRQKDNFILFSLANGQIKRLAMEEAANPRNSGIAVSKIEEGDEIVAVLVAKEKDEVMLFSQEGKVLRTQVAGISVQGRAARGVAGIKLSDGDKVVAASLAVGPVVMITQKGMGRQSDLAEFPTQGRGGGGVWLYRPTDKTGPLVFAASQPKDGLVRVMTDEGEKILEGVGAGTRASVPKPLEVQGDIRAGSLILRR